MVHSAAHYKEQGSFFGSGRWLQTHSWERETWTASVTFLPSPPPLKSNSLDRKPLKRLLKIVLKMLRCSSSQLMTSGRGGCERIQFSLTVWGLGVGPGSDEYTGNTSWTFFHLFCFSSFVSGELTKVEGEPGRMEKGMWSGCIMWNFQIIHKIFILKKKKKKKKMKAQAYPAHHPFPVSEPEPSEALNICFVDIQLHVRVCFFLIYYPGPMFLPAVHSQAGIKATAHLSSLQGFSSR